MSADTADSFDSAAFQSALVLRDGCEGPTCEDIETAPARIDGREVALTLCRPCRKEYYGVSS